MSAYGVDKDRRIEIVGYIMALSVILYFSFYYYILNPYIPGDNFLLEILFFFLPVSSVGIAYLISLLLKPIIFKYCGIRDNSGIYEGFLKTSWDECNAEIQVRIIIEQKLFDLKILLMTDKSKGENNTAHIEGGRTNKITYTYVNDGSIDDLEIKIHRGTGILEINNGKLTGRYYNDPRDRSTYGYLELKKILK